MMDGLVPAQPHPVDGAASRFGGGRTPPPPPEFDGEPPSAPLARHLEAIRRFKWIALVILVVGTGAGVFLSGRVQPTYEVRGTIWISATAPPRAQTGPIRAEELLAQTSWVELFRAFAIVDSVVMKRRLFVQPERGTPASVFETLAIEPRVVAGRYALEVDRGGARYVIRDNEGNAVDSGATTDPVGSPLGLRWRPGRAVLTPQRRIGFTLTTPRDAGISLVNKLQISLPSNSNFMRLTLTATDPVEAAATLNLWMAEFVLTAADLKRRNLTEFAKILENQLAYAERRLRDAEVDLETFRVNTATLPSESGPVVPGFEAVKGPVFEDFFARRVEQDNLRRDVQSLARVVADIEGGRAAADALASMPTVLQLPGAEMLSLSLKELYGRESELRTAQRTYTDEHASVKRLQQEIATLRQTVLPRQASALLAQLREQERALETRVTAQASDLRGIPARTIREMGLRRQVTVAENLYASLQSRYEEAKLAEASAVADVSSLDLAAAPNTPLRSQRQQLIALAFGLSLATGMGLPMLLGHLDQRFRHLDQVESELRLATLGNVPALGRRRSHPMTADMELVESFRCLRLSLQHSFPPGEPLVVAVSSAAAGDGKSLVASNLALALANSGYRTLLIDGDTRRGTLHDLFGVDRRPGLIDVLVTGSSPVDAVRATTNRRLWVIPSGSRSRQNAETVSGPRIPEMIAELRRDYNAIIVDTPPLSAGVDSLALSAACGNLIFVVRYGRTHLGLAKAMLELVDRLPVRQLGAVLNGVEAKGAFRYYTYSSGDYDVTGDETPAIAPAGIPVLPSAGNGARV